MSDVDARYLGLTANQLAKIATDLNAENARLRSELESVGTAAYLYGRNDLKDEIAKLRELCASLYEFSMSEYPDGTELNFADRMHELGIEVKNA